MMALPPAEFAKLLEHAKFEEGFRRETYRCPAGKPTIGFGFNLLTTSFTEAEARLLGAEAGRIRPALHDSLYMSQRLAERVLTRLLTTCVEQVEELAPNAPPEAIRVLADMCYNMGIGAVRQFTTTLKLINDGDFKGAAASLLKSKYAKQVPNRARRNSELLLSLSD